MITTKRHLFKFYFSIAFVTIVFLALGFLSLFSFHGFYMNGTLEFKNYFLPFLGVGCLIMPIYSIYQYFKNAPTISIDLEKITFHFLVNDMSYRLSDIEVIQLTGKLPFRYIVRFPMEGTLLMFKDGRNVMIFDDMYSNSWQLKTFLEEVVIHKNAFRIHDDITINESNIDWNNLYLFKGNQFTSMRGITLWGLIGFFLVFLTIKRFHAPLGFYIFMICLSTFWFLFHSYLMHYFGLDKNYLIIKNHNLFWIKKIYPISEIKEAVFETQGKMPNCLRIITKKYRSKLYPAGTLRNRDWLELKTQLEIKGVKVRNECI